MFDDVLEILNDGHLLADARLFRDVARRTERLGLLPATETVILAIT